MIVLHMRHICVDRKDILRSSCNGYYSGHCHFKRRSINRYIHRMTILNRQYIEEKTYSPVVIRKEW